MTHEEIYNKFKELFPTFNEETWITNGPDAIQITFDEKRDIKFIFTYVSDEVWSLETVKLYAENMKKDIEYKQLKRARERVLALDAAWDRLVSTNEKLLKDRRESLDKAWERGVFNNERQDS